MATISAGMDWPRVITTAECTDASARVRVQRCVTGPSGPTPESSKNQKATLTLLPANARDGSLPSGAGVARWLNSG